MQLSDPKTVEVIFVGGGHSHALALRHFAMNSLPGVSFTLISDRAVTPYSGMLPGHLAGKYTYDECHIDLRKLMNAVGGQFLIDQVTGLNPNTQQIQCQQHPDLRYDWLSLDIGSTPVIPDIPGAWEHGTPVKPWQPFLENWDQWTESLRRSPRSVTLVIVGGGAGGVELALNADAKFAEIFGDPQHPATIHLIHRGPEVLTSHNRWVQDRCSQLLQDRGIQTHLNCEVNQVDAKHVILSNGLGLNFDQLFWVTGATAPTWLQSTGLALDEFGFIRVGDDLRSLSHSNVFAAGDVATMVNHPRPKAGVFAVRQGKPLAQNLRRAIQGDPTEPFEPQQNFLSLIGTGQDRAIASWGQVPLGLESDWLWRWKDQIDRKFMDQFEALSAKMPRQDEQSEPEPMHCAGCGAKVGGDVLESVIAQIQQPQSSPDILIGLEGDDAAVVQVPDGQAIVHTVDYFRQLINDPYVFGQIATHHALSDLYAMGAQPQTALAIATIPYGSPPYQRNLLHQLLSGSVRVLNRAGAILVGGHTTEGDELAFGLSCNGLVSPDHILRKNGLQGGEQLILTQPLGTGVIFAEQHKTQSQWINHALLAMLQSNQAAGQIAQTIGATACTDITGFGLLGHLWEMVKSSAVQATIHLDRLRLLPGALKLSQQGVQSSLFEQNAQIRTCAHYDEALTQHPHWPLLFDPQTSGGLLLAVPATHWEDCYAQLQAAGYLDCHWIGEVSVGQPAIVLRS